ncbi:MAG: hypothetical protein KatS3mg077_2519 [Candidatus Binatia bacterium]|nr:MAG: hypothetical protein KatS3mg077_2519 [Candidatus Binatia bacterium]
MRSSNSKQPGWRETTARGCTGLPVRNLRERRHEAWSVSFWHCATGFACLIAAAVGFGCHTQKSAPSSRKHTVARELLRLPPTARRTSLAIGSDGLHFAYAEPTTAGQRVVFEGGADPEFEEVGNPVLLRETHTRLYWAFERRLGQQRLAIVENGRAFDTPCAQPGAFWLSRNGKRWATVCALATEGAEPQNGKRAAVLSNGEVIGSYGDVSVPTLSADGAHVAFVAERDDGQHVLVIDGQERRLLEAPPKEKASPAMRLSSRPPGLRQFRVTYLTDGSLMALIYDADGWAVYRNDQRIASFAHVWSLEGEFAVGFDQFRTAPTILAGSLTSADEAPAFAWWEKVPGQETQWRVVRNGEALPVVCEHYWEQGPPLLSDDGAHVAFPCWRALPVSRDTLLDVVAHGQRWGPYYAVWGLAFSPDGRHVAYAAAEDVERAKWRYFIGGRPFPLAYSEAWRPRFSPDGRHLAWEAMWKNRMVAVLDGDSVFSYDAVLWGPEFPRPNTVAWVVRRGQRVYRVETEYGLPGKPANFWERLRRVLSHGE